MRYRLAQREFHTGYRLGGMGCASTSFPRNGARNVRSQATDCHRRPEDRHAHDHGAPDHADPDVARSCGKRDGGRVPWRGRSFGCDRKGYDFRGACLAGDSPARQASRARSGPGPGPIRGSVRTAPRRESAAPGHGDRVGARSGVAEHRIRRGSLRAPSPWLAASDRAGRVDQASPTRSPRRGPCVPPGRGQAQG